LYRQSAYLAQTNRLFCPKAGTKTVQFLIKRFAFLGFEGQYWMLIAAGLVVAFIFFIWMTRSRI
jgi:nitrate reductase NapE component